jgi:DNA (cytosine-5)-methyltransferase 1
MNELALFAGAGGGILGGHLLGWRTVCAVEWEPYPASVLCAQQNDGFLPPFPVWDDVQTFDGKPWRGIVDVVSGGFPCQDISAAGKGAGIDGERSGMWREMARIIHEVRPKYVFVENSPMLTSRGLGVVLGDLASMGFDAKWGVLGAADVGANHKRDRIWIVGKMGNTNNNGQIATKVPTSIAQGSDTSSARPKQASQFTRPSEQYAELADTTELQRNGGNHNARISMERESVSEPRNSSRPKDVANTSDQGIRSRLGGNGWEPNQKDRTRSDNQGRSGGNVEFAEIGKPQDMEEKFPNALPTGLQGQDSQRGKGDKKWQDAKIWGHATECSWWQVEPNVGRVVDGVASRVDRLKAIGNGQVSEVARRAWESLSDL